MNKDLIMLITDTVAHVIRRYDLEVGPRALVELVTEVTETVEDHYNDPIDSDEGEEDLFEFGDELDDLFAETPEPAEGSFQDGEFGEGVRFGSQFAGRAKIEIYDSAFDEGFYAAGGSAEGLESARSFEHLDADEIDFEEGFRCGLEQAG